ncbi:Golgi-associated plant pathogenesis-related protein 1-like [Exaiptasia diaphana]|uniref:ShKT domain-containing protein n=1 Tax=Exaiptasia diaphana TaxID=2652724 RepID=A0A913Y9X0_EXADI|nr:Golgi-associated plant pathogenesis-related protein 1-like [Exaiptasia diaphana]
MTLVLLFALVVVSINGLPVPTATQSEPPTTLDCVKYSEDIDTEQCAYWVGIGDCTNPEFVDWMKENCRIACGFCPVPASQTIRQLSPRHPPINSVDLSACLEAHNAKRRLHGVPDLKWDSDLAATATSWAQRLASTDKLAHSKGNYGENIYFSWGTNEGTCEEAVQSWYDEIKDYDFDNPGFSSQTGHFTQVVWKSSTKLGVGKATADAGGGYKKTYIVAQYTPPGNYEGQYAANVLPKNGE